MLSGPIAASFTRSSSSNTAHRVEMAKFSQTFRESQIGFTECCSLDHGLFQQSFRFAEIARKKRFRARLLQLVPRLR